MRIASFFSILFIVVGLNALPLDGGDRFGSTTQGGLGGNIIRVTNLNSSGRGSLRNALWEKGARVVVFEVSGVIDLEGKSLNVSQPFLTIAGQTAPSPGITLIRGGLFIKTHDVIVQDLKVRVGEAGHEKGSGWETDCISMYAAHDVKIDHCSCSWATDENVSVSGPRFEGESPEEWQANTSHHVTISNCIIAEALSNSTHGEGEHSKGTLLHDNVTSVLLCNNLYANNKDRNPFAKGGTHAAIVNNWISNPGSKAISHGVAESVERKGNPSPTSSLTIIGNLFEHGPDSARNSPLLRNYSGPAEIFLSDNRSIRFDGKNAPSKDGPAFSMMSQTPQLPQNFHPLPVGKVKEHIRRNAGARRWERDAVDTRIVEAALSGTGKIIHDEGEVGGYPVQETGRSEFHVKQWDLEKLKRRE